MWQDEQKELDEITAKRQKRGKNEEEAPAEEKTILHSTTRHNNIQSTKRVFDLLLTLRLSLTAVKDAYDYQGRSYLHIPQDVGINLRSPDIPDKCYLPKKQLHVWTGHTKVSRRPPVISVCRLGLDISPFDSQACNLIHFDSISIHLEYIIQHA